MHLCLCIYLCLYPSVNLKMHTIHPRTLPRPTSQHRWSQSEPPPPTPSSCPASSFTSRSHGGTEEDRGSWSPHPIPLFSALLDLHVKLVYSLSRSSAPLFSPSQISPPSTPSTPCLLPSNSRSIWSHPPITVSLTLILSLPIHCVSLSPFLPMHVDTHIPLT